MEHGAPDLKNRLAPAATLCKSCNEATHEGSVVDMSLFSDAKKLLIQVGAATGSPDSFSVVATMRENDTNDSSGDTQMTDVHESSGVSADSLTITAAGIYVLHVENTKRYAMPSFAVTFVNGSSPAVPISACFVGHRAKFG